MLLFILLTVELIDRPDGKIIAEAAAPMHVHNIPAQAPTPSAKPTAHPTDLKMDIRYVKNSNRYGVDGDSYYYQKQQRLLHALTQNNL